MSNEIEKKEYYSIEQSLTKMNQGIVAKVQDILPVITSSDNDIRELTSKSNSNFTLVNSIVGNEVTPIAAIRHANAQLRSLKGALRENLQRNMENGVIPAGDDLDLYNGAIESVRVIGECVSTIKKLNNLPDVITSEMYLADENKAAIMLAFHKGYAQAVSAGGNGLAGQGYAEYASKCGIGVMKYQWEINQFLNKYTDDDGRVTKPAEFDEEWAWFDEMGEKYKDHPRAAQILKGYGE